MGLLKGRGLSVFVCCIVFYIVLCFVCFFVCWVVVLFWVLLICLLFGCVGFVDGLGAGVRDYIYMLCWVLGWGIINIGLLSTNLYIYTRYVYSPFTRTIH